MIFGRRGHFVWARVVNRAQMTVDNREGRRAPILAGVADPRLLS